MVCGVKLLKQYRWKVLVFPIAEWPQKTTLKSWFVAKEMTK
jgi:hypothetical protein